MKSHGVEMVLPLKPTPAHLNCLENAAVQTRFFLTLSSKFTLDSTGLKLVLDWSLSIDRRRSKSHINPRKEREVESKERSGKRRKGTRRKGTRRKGRRCERERT